MAFMAAYPVKGTAYTDHIYSPASQANGQNFLCMTLPVAELNKILFSLTHPNVYDSAFTTTGTASAPALVASAQAAYSPSTAPAASAVQLTTQAGALFTHLAKNSQWNNDVAEYHVAPYY